MKKIASILLVIGIGVLGSGCSKKVPDVITSPDTNISVSIFVTEQNTLAYSVTRAAQPVILQSDLGLQLTSADFTQGVTIESRSRVIPVSDDYTLRVGKKSHITYHANEQTFSILNAQQQKLILTFRVSDDGVAFRYAVKDSLIANKTFVNETTSFQFAENTRAWLQPMSVAQTGWSNTNPSYEEHYQMDIAVGTPSTLGAGWAFPALFKTGDNWVLVSEAGINRDWHASRLHHESPNGEYRVAPPQSPEIFIAPNGEKGALLANSSGDLISPWRILAMGDLPRIMESTLGTDLAEPAISVPDEAIKPGHASWSWAILKDDFTTFDVQKTFIDYAAEMHWDYTLIDADWDKKIGYEKLQELVDYAAQKKIGILVWYNSSGDWNKTPYSPKSELLSHEQRKAVFARLKKIGVKGLKIDFFAGDGQSMIAYYTDIMIDAAAEGLLLNFHGATLPRGWQRTYPHLMTVEAIKGFEFTTFSQADQDSVAAHVAMSLFARNVFDPMDFTPMAFGDIPNIKRVTENSFELAESVLMISGIQHFAEIPEGMATAPEYVKQFLQDLPREWDEVKFIDGYPGKYAAIARRAGDVWYIAGINAEQDNKTLNLDLGFAAHKNAVLITSGDTERSFSQQDIGAATTLTITLRPSAGFVMVLK
ncbi:glycoside hydrolase family 97 protein [Cellvibrio sp. PSBB023]|uniref:glycoside hydrolase family 97 protein n=1 Tax=Cellvibrio sp. PSBB023 TaxID=1945512 RepID=UPI00098F5936|nr:glycoside hydrolase family 97 protein [Cellvibrio sp. PSBB023]AQT62151.1 alpha-glucosidase [Cellvibrio sp. PSBB023]